MLSGPISLDLETRSRPDPGSWNHFNSGSEPADVFHPLRSLRSEHTNRFFESLTSASITVSCSNATLRFLANEMIEVRGVPFWYYSKSGTFKNEMIHVFLSSNLQFVPLHHAVVLAGLWSTVERADRFT